jgi:hypothetical protein
MSPQHEALRLAETLETTDQLYPNADLSSQEIATELRRLHQINTNLITALTRLSTAAMSRENVMGDPCALFAAQASVRDATVLAQAAIAAAMKETP